MNFLNVEEELFYKALRIRMVEERIIQIYPSDKIQSPVHLSIGQESVAVGACHPLKKNDLVFCNYRSHAFYLAKGGNLNQMMAELYGKVTGCGRGKAGSMHLFDSKVGMMVSSAVVASTIPHAVGAALAAKRQKTGQVILAIFGDGATEEGVFHESMNFAALHRLPVLFLCENNGLAIHSPLEARQAYQISELAKPYGMPVHLCKEGYDLTKVHSTFEEAISYIRKEGGPCFVEVRTFRYREHVGPGEDFAAGYRSKKDCDAWMAKDPLCQNHSLNERFRGVISREIEDSVKFAEASPWPGKEELLADII